MHTLGYDITETTVSGRNLESTNRFYTIVKWAAAFIAIVILFMIVFFGIINDYKKIGVEKLLGYNLKAVWFKRMPRVLLIETLISIMMPGIACLLLFRKWSPLTFGFFLGQLYIHSIIILISALLMTLPFLYIRKIKVSDILKNRSSSALALWFNNIVKLVLSVILVCLAFEIFGQLTLIRSRYSSSYEIWESVRSYAVIRNSVIKSDIYDPYSKDNISGFRQAYLEFNSMGAVYADFSAYEQTDLQPVTDSLQGISSPAMINANYLKLFPVYDISGDMVNVDEEENDLILLVPERYMANEAAIMEQYANGADPEQDVRIIWIKDDQSFFTWQLTINPEEGNCVTDPLIFVFTENNIGSFCNNITSSVLYIPVEDTDDPSAEINTVMGKYFDSSKVTFPAYGIYSLVETQIKSSRQSILLFSILLILLAIIMAFVILQNVINYFDRHKQRLAVQHFLGFSTFSKYNSYLLLSLASCPVIYAICALIVRSFNVYFFALAVTLLELLITMVFIYCNERRNVVRVLKGG